MVVFKCMGCGVCCRLSPITLLPHEVYVVKREARRLGLEVSIKPGYKVYDALSRRLIVLSYHLELDSSGKCPFLTSNNKCLLHGRAKPSTCKSFPYVPKEIHYYVDRSTRTIIHRSVYGISTACLFVKKFSKQIEEAVKAYGIKKVFPSEYSSALEAENWRYWYMRMLTILWRSGLVDLYSVDDEVEAEPVNAYEFILSRIIILRSLLR